MFSTGWGTFPGEVTGSQSGNVELFFDIEYYGYPLSLSMNGELVEPTVMEGQCVLSYGSTGVLQLERSFGYEGPLALYACLTPTWLLMSTVRAQPFFCHLGHNRNVVVSRPGAGPGVVDGRVPTGARVRRVVSKKPRTVRNMLLVSIQQAHALFAATGFEHPSTLVDGRVEVVLEVGVEEVDVLLHGPVTDGELPVGCDGEIQPSGVAALCRETSGLEVGPAGLKVRRGVQDRPALGLHLDEFVVGAVDARACTSSGVSSVCRHPSRAGTG